MLIVEHPLNMRNKWVWMMEYCKIRGISPAVKENWETAHGAFKIQNILCPECKNSDIMSAGLDGYWSGKTICEECNLKRQP